MIHYHGTPITPAAALREMAGRHFCVSHAAPQSLVDALRVGASVMGDNGAFSAFTKGVSVDWAAYYRWLEPWLQHPHWCVIPDVIGGSVDEQRELRRACSIARALAAPVWHLHLPLDYLSELSDEFPKVCFGSSGEFWNTQSAAWRCRIDEAFNHLSQTGRRPWVHMLRAMDAASKGEWPFGSADSTNVARNWKRNGESAEEMALRIDAANPTPTLNWN